jgi:hypothetical protein
VRSKLKYRAPMNQCRETKQSCMQKEEIFTPLRFFRICFGSLMIVYCLGKLSSQTPLPNQKPVDMFNLQPFSLHQRLPAAVSSVSESFPWMTSSHLYWHAHLPLELLCAVALTFGGGLVSRLGCLTFSLFQAITVLMSMAHYNNHVCLLTDWLTN